MDAITMLREDHKTVRSLFQRIDKTGERATAQLEKLARQVITELSMHAAIEEQLFYPTVRKHVSGSNDTVLESLEEHHVVKWVLNEIDTMAPTDERYRAKLSVLKENVLHHAQEEEQELFPKVREALSRADLRELGEQMQMAKRMAPTHPHPRSPDSPPFNLVTGTVAAVTDRARDRGKEVVRRATRSAGRTAGRATTTATKTTRKVARTAPKPRSRSAR